MWNFDTDERNPDETSIRKAMMSDATKAMENQEDKSTDTGKKDRAKEIANTFEWLITAFILAFVFRAFVMEAFRIPTGSMADTLKGAHFRMCCSQCGYKYDHNFMPGDYRYPQDTVPRADVPPPRTRCPNCGYFPSSNEKMLVSNGDRILVLKCFYQFFEPQRWDVVVFKSPLEPRINFIKRLIGRPHETIEIIDGDIYIDGESLEGERFDRYYYSNSSSFQYGVETTVVPDGHYFMLGDNSGNSFDSRYWGFVADDDIVGVPYLRVWPLNRIGIM